MFEKWETEIEEEFEGRLEAAVTMMASRNKNKFKVPDEIREMTEAAATCRNLVSRKDLRGKKRLGRQEENSTPGWELFPKERQFKHPWWKSFGSMDRRVKTEMSGCRR